MNAELSYFYPWAGIPNEVVPRIVREFLDNGVNRFVFTDGQARRCLDDPEYLAFTKKLCKDMGIQFVSMHGLCGGIDMDLDIIDQSKRPHMIETHIRAMELAKEFGSKTYTIHVGAYAECCQHVPIPELRKLSLDSMEKLVPAAERIGIVIAVENSFEPANTPTEVLWIVNHFAGNPAVGVCFDIGHANMMMPAPWKKPENYPDYQKRNWANGFVTVPDALEQLQPHIVTTHIHDNDGYRDLHGMPFDGVIDWKVMMPKLRNCPRMLEYQTEVCMDAGVNWAGNLLAPVGGYSVKRLVESFRKLGF